MNISVFIIECIIMAVKKIAALLVVLFLFAWMAHKAGAETHNLGNSYSDYCRWQEWGHHP